MLDSINHIQNQLRGRKAIQIVADQERAQVVLEVMSRGDLPDFFGPIVTGEWR